MPTELEALTQGLFDACDERLGDSLTITPPAGEPIACVAHVDYGEMADGRGLSAVIVRAIRVDIDKAILPGKPGAGWRISLPRLPGVVLEPKGVEDDESGAGLRWSFGVSKVLDA